MRKLLIACASAACVFGAFAETVVVQDGREVFVHNANYDKSKIAPYTLEDPLTFVDGRKVKTVADCPQIPPGTDESEGRSGLQG